MADVNFNSRGAEKVQFDFNKINAATEEFSNSARGASGAAGSFKEVVTGGLGSAIGIGASAVQASILGGQEAEEFSFSEQALQVGRGLAVAGASFAGFEYVNRKIPRASRVAGVATRSAVRSFAGAKAGAVVGTSVGSAIAPVIGTILGLIIGAALGIIADAVIGAFGESESDKQARLGREAQELRDENRLRSLRRFNSQITQFRTASLDDL